jgi:hypothetical protein
MYIFQQDGATSRPSKVTQAHLDEEVQCFHHTVFPSLFGEHSKTGKTRFSVCPYYQVTAYFVNVLLGNTRIWETLKNVTPAPSWVKAIKLVEASHFRVFFYSQIYIYIYI